VEQQATIPSTVVAVVVAAERAQRHAPMGKGVSHNRGGGGVATGRIPSVGLFALFKHTYLTGS